MIKLRSRPRARSIWPSKISRNSARLTIRLAELCEAPTILKSKSSAVGFHQSPGSRRAAPGSHDRIGGEPLVRRDIITLFRALGRHIREGSLDELTLTTNGSQLARYAEELRECGVRRVNISVDTLDPAKFTEITRRGRLDQVLEGLAA